MLDVLAALLIATAQAQPSAPEPPAFSVAARKGSSRVGGSGSSGKGGHYVGGRKSTGKAATESTHESNSKAMSTTNKKPMRKSTTKKK